MKIVAFLHLQAGEKHKSRIYTIGRTFQRTFSHIVVLANRSYFTSHWRKSYSTSDLSSVRICKRLKSQKRNNNLLLLQILNWTVNPAFCDLLYTVFQYLLPLPSSAYFQAPDIWSISPQVRIINIMTKKYFHLQCWHVGSLTAYSVGLQRKIGRYPTAGKPRDWECRSSKLYAFFKFSFNVCHSQL